MSNVTEQLYNRDAIESGRFAQFIIRLDPLVMNPSQLGDYRTLPIIFNALRFLFGVLFVYTVVHRTFICNMFSILLSNPHNTSILESHSTRLNY